MAALGLLEFPVPGILPMVSAARLPVEHAQPQSNAFRKPDLEDSQKLLIPKAGRDIDDLASSCIPHVMPTSGSSSFPAQAISWKSDIPLIDLMSSDDLTVAVQRACEGGGFFQVVNHGISASLIREIHNEAEQYFSLRREGKGQNSFDRGCDWARRDTLKLICAPASAVSLETWPLQPTGLRENLMEYITEQKELLRKLLEVISESLGLQKEYILNDCEEPRMMLAINRYPVCLEPPSKIGIREHSDPCTVTVLSQNGVSGLQVCKQGAWVDVNLLENALFVNLGDHLQILTNGKYLSCLHRVVTNDKKTRVSTALFLSPSISARLKPAPALINASSPSLFREFVYGDFLKSFYETSEIST